MSTFLEDFNKYMSETPKEQIEADWKATEKFDSVGIPVDQFIEYNRWMSFAKEIPKLKKELLKHEFKSIPYEDVMSNRSSAYKFIDFNNPTYSKDNENNKAC